MSSRNTLENFEVDRIIQQLVHYQTVSIIGMEKNVGKTTTLNFIISRIRTRYKLGLTSIGRDGETIDVVTATAKPRIYIEKGTIIATAKQCVEQSDITKEILANTCIGTPLGEIIIVRALSDGYIEIAGPSQTEYLSQICNELLKLGCELVLVDGALSRKTFAAPSITDATILATGASLSRNMDAVSEMTAHTVRLLSFDKLKNPHIMKLTEQISRVGIIDKNEIVKNLQMTTALDSELEIINSLSKDMQYLVIKGAVSDNLLIRLMENSLLYKEFTLLVADGTKLFLSKDILYQYEKTGGKILVLSPIKILCLTANPFSPLGYEFDPKQFLSTLRCKISLPIFDLVGGN
ncbi:hypothetical protein NEF87_002589 [Candidatus Lokiarchaeum ossiferum]|uniref:Uncharacterized protein n=1 Tax=Candidatus Lokiarchaeum ossiferum TaxID=2951803 RepID=A0ABY6HV15_9ARCH|nr:hypothetical protein NEF87_002589 [Candidatus Lokiarchaeum sp. B-35]